MLRPMDESGFDTLKATCALEAAGFASGQAEAMVTVFGGAIVANVATKWDIRDLKGDIRGLKGDISGLKDEIGTLRIEFDAKLEQQIGTLRTEVKRDIGALRTEFDAKLEQQIGTLRTELKSEIAEVRLSVESLKATMYKLLLAQAAVIVGLIFGLQRFL
ncbi:MAG: hypothetical protein F4Y24_08690 [Gemmatimonadetes bacterium]|nr:hypothetical protein [Gemmatimonadota bacterium]MYG24353.1 hypothetical protein [Gemmatimonadota bacterium]MYJ40591.1 hypothetical protein [Gemmatimonadota bacterium]